jgi:hypothetical protein
MALYSFHAVGACYCVKLMELFEEEIKGSIKRKEIEFRREMQDQHPSLLVGAENRLIKLWRPRAWRHYRRIAYKKMEKEMNEIDAYFASKGLSPPKCSNGDWRKLWDRRDRGHGFGTGFVPWIH